MRLLLAVLLLLMPLHAAWAWGADGHSIVAEIAHRRLSPAAAAEVTQLLGPNHSLASVSSWADDIRDARPETYNWHFVDIPIASDRYNSSEHCRQSTRGDCIVAALERLRVAVRCDAAIEARRDALRFIVHFVGDIHQPFHTVDEERGGNDVPVEVRMVGARTCRGGPCPMRSFHTNLHALWDTGLIQQTTWSWGAYVDQLEASWLRSSDAKNRADGGVVDWAEQTHKTAQTIWRMLPENHVVDDTYYKAVRPFLDEQLGLAGLRLATFLDEAFASGACPIHH